MSKNKTEKRVVNIPKEQFDLIKSYCEEHSLDMVSWIIKNTIEKVVKKIPDELITVEQAKELLKNSKNVQLPDNWLELALKDIDEGIKLAATRPYNNTDEKNIQSFWGPYITLTNLYGKETTIDLTDTQVGVVRKELEKRGFTLEQNLNAYTRSTRFVIKW